MPLTPGEKTESIREAISSNTSRCVPCALILRECAFSSLPSLSNPARTLVPPRSTPITEFEFMGTLFDSRLGVKRIRRAAADKVRAAASAPTPSTNG